LTSPEQNTESTPEPKEGTPTRLGGSDSWVLKSVNDLREDIRGLDGKLDRLYSQAEENHSSIRARLEAVESRIQRLMWLTGGIGITLAALWGGYELLTAFFDINMTIAPKTN